MSRWLHRVVSTSATLQRQQVVPWQVFGQAGQVLPLGLILSAVVLIAWVRISIRVPMAFCSGVPVNARIAGGLRLNWQVAGLRPGRRPYGMLNVHFSEISDRSLCPSGDTA